MLQLEPAVAKPSVFSIFGSHLTDQMALSDSECVATQVFRSIDHTLTLPSKDLDIESAIKPLRDRRGCDLTHSVETRRYGSSQETSPRLHGRSGWQPAHPKTFRKVQSLLSHQLRLAIFRREKTTLLSRVQRDLRFVSKLKLSQRENQGR